MLKAEKKLYFCILCGVLGILLALIFNKVAINDEMEHLRMSWLVGHGEVPYRDFFEHHHPLIWYLFAPIIMVLPHNILWSFYTAKLVSFICVLITYYIIYLMIKRFLGGVHLVPYFFVVLFMFYPIWYGSSLFKPDTFSRLFYFLGLYQFFCYLETEKRSCLVYGAISFTISFLFLQTIVFSILPLAIPMGFYLYKNPRKISDYMSASVIPLIILGGGLLIIGDTWKEYYQLNWILNREMLSITNSTETRVYDYIVVLIAALIILILRYRRNLLSDYDKILGILFLAEFIQHIYMPATYSHYLILLFIFTALIVFPVFEKIFADYNNKQIKLLIYIFLLMMLCINFVTLYFSSNKGLWSGFNMVNANEEAVVINVSQHYTPVYTKKYSYYGLYNSLHYLDDKLFHRIPEYDVSKLIEEQKPKYITYDIQIDKKKKIPKRFRVSKEVLEKYEEITHWLWQRKETLEK